MDCVIVCESNDGEKRMIGMTWMKKAKDVVSEVRRTGMDRQPYSTNSPRELRTNPVNSKKSVSVTRCSDIQSFLATLRRRPCIYAGHRPPLHDVDETAILIMEQIVNSRFIFAGSKFSCRGLGSEGQSGV